MSQEKFCVIYFIKDKSFALYPICETNWNSKNQEQLENRTRKIIFSAFYDGEEEKVILVQMADSEESLRPALEYAMALKRQKKMPIELILGRIERVRPTNRQIFAPLNVNFLT